MYVKHGHPRAKLDPDKVRLIRQWALYENHTALARRFGVSRSLIDNVLRGHAWKGVTSGKESRRG